MKRMVHLIRIAVPLSVFAAIFFAGMLAPVVAPFDPLEQEVTARLEPPSRGHLFGTDGFGRDVFSRTLYAVRLTLAVAIASVALAAAIGVPAGATAALAGGATDMVVQRITDVVLGFPSVVLAVVIVVAMRPSPLAVGLAITIGLTPGITRVSRAAALVVAVEPYVLAAHTLGLGRVRVVARHILPAIVPQVFAQLSGSLGIAIVTETTMSFLGLGVPPPLPSLGRMLQEGARQYFEAAPWVTLFPGVAVAILVVSFALVSDAIGDVAHRAPMVH